MIVIKINERLHKKNSSTIVAEREDEESLVSSFDFYNEDIIEKDDRDNYFFIEDTIIRYYKVYSTEDNNNDIEILQTLKDFALSDPTELRYWFKNIPKGENELKTSWEINESENIKFLIYDGYDPIEKEK